MKQLANSWHTTYMLVLPSYMPFMLKNKAVNKANNIHYNSDKEAGVWCRTEITEVTQAWNGVILAFCRVPGHEGKRERGIEKIRDRVRDKMREKEEEQESGGSIARKAVKCSWH